MRLTALLAPDIDVSWRLLRVLSDEERSSRSRHKLPVLLKFSAKVEKWRRLLLDEGAHYRAPVESNWGDEAYSQLSRDSDHAYREQGVGHCRIEKRRDDSPVKYLGIALQYFATREHRKNGAVPLDPELQVQAQWVGRAAHETPCVLGGAQGLQIGLAHSHVDSAGLPVFTRNPSPTGRVLSVRTRGSSN